MPRVGFSKADASEGSSGLQAGNYEIVDISCKIHQFPANSKTGIQSGPFTCVRVDFAPLDEDGNKKKSEEPSSQYLRVGEVDSWHPGSIDETDKNNLDVEVEDLGGEVDVEGNTLFSVDPAGRLWAKCPWMLFSSSLETQGFKSEILGRGFFPDLLGTKLEVMTEARPYVDKKTGEARTGIDLLVKHIIERPYEKGAAKGKVGATKPVVKGKVAPVATKAVTVESSDDEDAELKIQAMELITTVAPQFAGKNVKREEFQRAVLLACMKAKVNAKIQVKIMGMLKDDENLMELLVMADLEAASGITADKIQF